MTRGQATTNKRRRLAQERGLTWEIDEAQYRSVIGDGICHWCNGRISGNGIGLDRIDNSIGYRIDNVVPCCVPCNMERRTLSFAEYTAVWQVRRLVVGIDAAATQRIALGVANKIRSGTLAHQRTNRDDAGQATAQDPEWRALLAERIRQRNAGWDPDRTLPPMPDGESVAEWRLRLGITQTEATAILRLHTKGKRGWSRRTVQRREAGAVGVVALKKKPPPTDLEYICEDCKAILPARKGRGAPRRYCTTCGDLRSAEFLQKTGRGHLC